jgi:hypothetical protein
MLYFIRKETPLVCTGTEHKNFSDTHLIRANPEVDCCTVNLNASFYC